MKNNVIVLLVMISLLACNSNPKQPLDGLKLGLWLPDAEQSALLTKNYAALVDSVDDYYSSVFILNEDPEKILAPSMLNDPIYPVAEYGYLMGRWGDQVIRQDSHFIVIEDLPDGSKQKVAYRHLMQQTKGMITVEDLKKTTWELSPAIDGINKFSFGEADEEYNRIRVEFFKEVPEKKTGYEPFYSAELEAFHDILFMDIGVLYINLRVVVLEVNENELKTLVIDPPYNYRECTWTKVEPVIAQ